MIRTGWDKPFLRNGKRLASIDRVELSTELRDQHRVRVNGKRPAGSKLCGSYVMMMTIMMMMTTA